MDNEGQYATYDQLLLQLSIAGSSKVLNTGITLSNKVVNASGDVYDFTVAAGDPDPEIGDVICQGGRTAIILSLPTATEIKINKTGAENTILESLSKLLHSDTVPQQVGEDFIQEAMDMIDKLTRRFFNKRTFDDTNPVTIEGSNTPVIFFATPIIEITSLEINSSGCFLTEGEDDDFVAFKSRGGPVIDDRENPMIKLNVGHGRDSIFATSTRRLFTRRTLTKIQGAFGYLEPNGSTPKLITKATLLLAVESTANGIGSANSGAAGPLKRKKLDLHEKEFFELKDQTSKGKKTPLPEVDRIIGMYKAPIKLGGSFPLLPNGTGFSQRTRIE